MRADRLHKFMGFMMNVFVNMDRLMYGDTVQKYSTFYLWQLLLMKKYSVYMEVCLHLFKL